MSLLHQLIRILIPLGLLLNIIVVLAVNKQRFRPVETKSTVFSHAFGTFLSCMNLAFFLFVPILQAWSVINIFPIHTAHAATLQVTGLALFVAGVTILLAGRVSLKRNYENGITPRARTDQDLVTTGVYSISRNPIYTGKIIAFMGYELAGPTCTFL